MFSSIIFSFILILSAFIVVDVGICVLLLEDDELELLYDDEFELLFLFVFGVDIYGQTPLGCK